MKTKSAIGYSAISVVLCLIGMGILSGLYLAFSSGWATGFMVSFNIQAVLTIVVAFVLLALGLFLVLGFFIYVELLLKGESPRVALIEGFIEPHIKKENR